MGIPRPDINAIRHRHHIAMTRLNGTAQYCRVPPIQLIEQDVPMLLGRVEALERGLKRLVARLDDIPSSPHFQICADAMAAAHELLGERNDD